MTVPARYLVGIAPYRDGDSADLRAFQERMFGPGAHQLDRARFAWLFERNPARLPDRPGLWVCRRDGIVVGQQGEIAVDLSVLGEPDPGRSVPGRSVPGRSVPGRSVPGRSVPAAWTIDLMVDPAWRIRGVGPGLVATQLAGCGLALGLTHSDAAVKVYERGGWTEVGSIPVYLRPLDAGRALRVAPVSRWVRRFAGAAGPVLRGVDLLLAGAARVAGLRLVPVDRFDSRVDEVWDATVASGDFGVLARRDAATTRWRIDDRPDTDRLQRYYLARRDRTLGYVALRPTERWGEPAALVVDYLAPARWVAPLLTAAAQAARRDGAVMLVCRTLCQPADRSLRRAGFVRRGDDVEAPLRFFVRCTIGDEVASATGRAESWLLTAADSDLEHPVSPSFTGSSPVPASIASEAHDS